jgi:hypothetical protein
VFELKRANENLRKTAAIQGFSFDSGDARVLVTIGSDRQFCV